MCKFAVVDVDRADEETHRLSVLDGKVAKTTTAGNGYPLAWSRGCLFEALICGDAGADEWGSFCWRQAFGNVSDIVGVSEDVFGEAAVFGVAAELGGGTDSLPRAETVFAVATG